MDKNEMKKYMDSSLPAKERARLLLEEMTVDEKLGQLTCVFGRAALEDQTGDLLKNGVGQVSSTLSFPDETKADIAAHMRKLQKLVIESNRLHIPAIFHMEGLCGAFFNESTAFPSGVSRGSGFDPELEEQIGQIVSRQEAAYGITQILAPVLDVSRDSRMGRQGETYGEDPTLTAALGTAFTRGIQETETAGRRPESVAKHFLGFHNSQGGIHGASMEAGERLVDEIYGKPFQAAISDAHLKGVMPCYDSVNGLPIHASKHYLTDLLRNEMGFEGIVASDYCGVENAFNVQRIGENKADTGLRCLAAGMDIEMPMPTCYTTELADLFKRGEANLSILDRAVLRVLEAKFRMGIFEHPYALEGEELEKTVHHTGDDAVALKAARQALILLKNNGILPLKGTEKKIAVIGPQAANARYYFGGYTHLSVMEVQYAVMNSLAGFGAGGDTSQVEMDRVPGTNIQVDETEKFNSILSGLEPDCKNLLQVLKEELPDAKISYAFGYPKAGADESGFKEALELVKDADVVILTLGGKHGSGSIATMGEGIDGTNINLPACQDAFIRAASVYKKPMVGIHFDGRPISSDTADELLHAIIEAWNPATFSAQAIVEVLLGKVNPSGKLPLTVARNAGQIPVYYNHHNGSSWHQAPSIGFKDYVDCLHTPRYPFGYGLSYTEFEYREIILKSGECINRTALQSQEGNMSENMLSVTPFGTVDVRFKIRNIGACAGTEIVQLYLRDTHASMTRPVKELQGFARVELDAGDEKTIHFTIHPSQMAFLDEDMRWKIEKGEIEVQIGSSSEDIHLTDSFMIMQNAWVSGRDRSFWAETEIL